MLDFLAELVRGDWLDQIPPSPELPRHEHVLRECLARHYKDENPGLLPPGRQATKQRIPVHLAQKKVKDKKVGAILP